MLRGRYYFLLISFEVATHQKHTNSLLPPEITAEAEKSVWIIIIPMRYDKHIPACIELDSNTSLNKL